MNQSAWQPGRPAVRQVWVWPPGAPVPGWPAQKNSEVRIGDVERDRAVAALGDHFAAGRLTREEFDERIEQAMQARFDRDLRPLFADLPDSADLEHASPATKGWRMGASMAVPLFFWLLPLFLVATVIAAVALSAPWMLWGLLWFFMISRFWGRRYSSGRWHYR
jgi:Domain of unknown function (DUF1707)